MKKVFKKKILKKRRAKLCLLKKSVPKISNQNIKPKVKKIKINKKVEHEETKKKERRSPRKNRSILTLLNNAFVANSYTTLLMTIQYILKCKCSQYR